MGDIKKSVPKTVYAQILKELEDQVHPNSESTTGDGYYSRKDLAKMLDISPETVDRWRRLGCPHIAHGNHKATDYPLAEVFAWYIRTIKGKGGQIEGKEDLNKKMDRLAKREIILTRRMQRKELAGELIRANVVQKELLRLVEMMREIGTTLETNFGKEALEIHNEGLDEIRDRLVRSLEDD